MLPVSDDNNEQKSGMSRAGNSSTLVPLRLLFSGQQLAMENLFKRCKQVLNVTSSGILKDQYLRLLEHATMSIECKAFGPLQLIQMLCKSKMHLYPDIFELIKLCLCFPMHECRLEKILLTNGNSKDRVEKQFERRKPGRFMQDCAWANSKRILRKLCDKGSG